MFVAIIGGCSDNPTDVVPQYTLIYEVTGNSPTQASFKVTYGGISWTESREAHVPFSDTVKVFSEDFTFLRVDYMGNNSYTFSISIYKDGKVWLSNSCTGDTVTCTISGQVVHPTGVGF